MIGLDLHKRESQLCILSEDGELAERRIATTRERFTATLGSRPRARVLLEASTESEWVARHLESLGHEVIVADPNYAPMYATRTRRVKTDKRDARTLADACRLGAYRAAHRLSEERRHVRAELAVREALVRTRTRYIALARALVRRDGLRLPSGESESAPQRLRALDSSPLLAAELAPLLAMLTELNDQIAAADRRLTAIALADSDMVRLATAPQIGPVTASAFVATVDDIQRFHSAHQLEAYIGLVPGERSSGEKQRRGRITKAGNSRVRYLLVEAAWRILRSRKPETAALRAWAMAIAVRRGKRVAVVALARRLAGILYAMWRDGAAYEAERIRGPRPTADEQVSQRVS
jgi:transposase